MRGLSTKSNPSARKWQDFPFMPASPRGRTIATVWNDCAGTASVRRSLRSDSRSGRMVRLSTSCRVPWPNSAGTTHLILDPIELLQRLAALIPVPYTHLIRRHGVFASLSKYRSLEPTRSTGSSSSRGSGGSGIVEEGNGSSESKSETESRSAKKLSRRRATRRVRNLLDTAGERFPRRSRGRRFGIGDLIVESLGSQERRLPCCSIGRPSAGNQSNRVLIFRAAETMSARSSSSIASFQLARMYTEPAAVAWPRMAV